MSETPPRPVRYRLLGPIEVSGPDGAVRLGGPKQRSVLAALLLNAGRVVPDEQLFSLVWGAAPPATVRGQVQVYVSELRKLIGAPVITRRAPGYVIEVGPGELDLHEFDEALEHAQHDLGARRVEDAARRLREALDLWRGPALGGVTQSLLDREGPPLAEKRLSALEDYFDAELAAGRHRSVVAGLRQEAEEHPFRERLQALLMLVLHRCGRTPEALEVYTAVRSRLIDELGVEPGPLLRETQVRLLRDEPVDTAPVPRQLPGDVPQFAGRMRDLARLDAVLPLEGDSRPSVSVAVVSGGAGVGKSAFAVHWAHRACRHFPDGQLYVNLRGFDPGACAMSPAEAVRRFLDALAVPAQRIPVSVEAQTSLYRSLLADKRVLVVLDNARDADQVRPLLPGSPGSITVVTSRNQLAGLVAVEGAAPVSLDLLSDSDARELLERRLGADRVAAEPDAVAQINTLCARLPLALAIVAARAATNPGFTLTELATELRTARGRLDAFEGDDDTSDVRAVFSWSYHAVSGDAARLFRFLGLHPGPHITVAAAASLLGIDVRRVRPLLAELTRAHLVTERAPGRYAFHDLLRAYAIELTHEEDPEAERTAAVRRMFDHYVHTAHAGAAALAPQRQPVMLAAPGPGVTVEPPADAAAWFAAEHPVLVAVIERAAATGFDVPAWQLACALSHTFVRQGRHWLGEPGTYRTALAAAERLGDPVALAHSHRGLAVIFTALGRDEEARTQLDHALGLFEELGDLGNQADVRQGLTWVCDRLGDYGAEYHHARRALELFQTSGNRFGEALALNNVGWSCARLGRYEQALGFCQEAIARQAVLGNLLGEANAWDSVGYAQKSLGRLGEAVRCYEKAVAMYRRHGSRYYESRSLNHLGDAHQARGDLTAARRAWQAAVELLEELGSPDAARTRAKLGTMLPQH
ncbi:BTAD domain-containing putative transcriptional regulator [Amycolatopsis endophytica]|uniref:DNA-binding SARP family transcriptional activator/tetratricopeptide (TPR) repeat protein n=1 Tax=Amycolatopsis endophytica TaxID=860233 RepID=A0A853BDT0_9PSEU|nr:BTAD domain-containing putative transcriptional regulator [Amycolatopsis endophytica]NYI93409.1 DNA-binding SARP family transcriptional activator/tetratricopeptide (TPR) repeat protein [Amycolatopsis endophytica]